MYIFLFYVSAVKLLEPLISAAAAPTCQSPGENDIPPERVSHGPVVHSPVISRTPVTDVTASNSDYVEETTTEQAAESIVPYDEIPVGRLVIVHSYEYGDLGSLGTSGKKSRLISIQTAVAIL